MKKSFLLLSVCLILAVALSPLVVDAGRKKVKITNIKAASGLEYVEGKGGLDCWEADKTKHKTPAKP